MNSISPVMPWAMGPDHPRWTETLRDQRRVLIRPIAPKDIEADRAFIESLSPEARRFRFLGEVRHPSEQMLVRLTTPDYNRDVAFAAIAADAPDGRSRVWLATASGPMWCRASAPSRCSMTGITAGWARS